MNKTELVASVAEKTAMTKKDAEKALNAVFASIEEALAKEEKVQVIGFGTFEVKAREARTGRNPQTGGLDGEPSSTKGIFLASSNLGRLKTDGVDLTVNYRRDIGFADLSMALNGNWTNSSTFKATPSSINRECVGQFNADCGSLQPKIQWSLRTTLGFEKVDVSALWRHIDSFTGPSDAFKGTLNGWGTVDFTKIPSFDYFDLTTRVKITDNLTLTGTVQNLFNKKPPLVGATVGSTAFNSGNTYPSTYDTLGRRYAAALKVSF